MVIERERVNPALRALTLIEQYDFTDCNLQDSDSRSREDIP